MSIFARSGNWQDFWRFSPLTTIIFFLNTLMLVAALFTGGFDGLVGDWAYINYQRVFEMGEYYRLIAGAFHHWSFLHFAFNMVIGVIVLSSALERAIGTKKFAIVYFGSLVLSSSLTAYLSTIPSAGASGAIFGVLGCLLWISIFRKDILHYRDVQSIWVLVIFQVIATFTNPSVSIPAHIGGLVSGFLISYLIIRRNVFKVLH